MTDEPKAALAAALARTGPEAALAALGHAIDWSAAALSAEVGPGDDYSALQSVDGLDRALVGLGSLFDLVPALVRIAAAGPLVEDRLADSQERLRKQLSELAAERAALAAVGDVERQLREAQAERDAIQAQVSMLARQQQLAADLPGLRATLQELRDMTDEATSGLVEQVAQGLVGTVRKLADLTEEQRSLIGPELVEAANDALRAGEALAAETAQLAELRAEVTARQAEAAQLQQEYQQELPGLELYRRADQALSDALADGGTVSQQSAVERVRSSLADIREQLSGIDGKLKPLLQAHTTAYAEALRLRGWSG